MGLIAYGVLFRPLVRLRVYHSKGVRQEGLIDGNAEVALSIGGGHRLSDVAFVLIRSAYTSLAVSAKSNQCLLQCNRQPIYVLDCPGLPQACACPGSSVRF